MALVNGEWLNRSQRATYLDKLTENAKRYKKVRAEVGLTEAQLTRYKAILEERKRIERIHDCEFNLIRYMIEYFSEDGNPDNPDNLIPKGVNVLNSAHFHKTLCSLLDEITKGNQSTHVAWSVGRGHAKTAYLSNGYLCHQVTYRLKQYIVEISETTEVAGDFISWTRNQLKYNEKLRNDFGVLMHVQKSMNERDNNTEFITTTGTKVEAKGIGTQMRGLRHGNTRPDLFLLDDLESKNNTNTPELVEKSKSWFKEEMLPALSRKGMCIYMGTIVCFDSLLDYVIKERRDFVSKKFPAITSWATNEHLWQRWREIYRSPVEDAGAQAQAFYEANEKAMLEGTEVLWEQMFSYLDLMKLREESGVKAFNQEYLGNPTDEERQIFKPDDMYFFDDEDIAHKDLDYYCGIDFAMGKEKGDYSVIATLARDKATNICYVTDMFIERVHPDILLQETVKRALKYQYEVIAVEAQMAQEFFADKLGEDLKRHGYPANTRLKYVKQRTRKALRIEALLPDIQRGRLRFKEQHREMLEQFEMYPMHKHDDAPDAVSMAFNASKGTYGSVRVANKRKR
jgi:predicted phage terminase large subunit-like protein